VDKDTASQRAKLEDREKHHASQRVERNIRPESQEKQQARRPRENHKDKKRPHGQKRSRVGDRVKERRKPAVETPREIGENKSRRNTGTPRMITASEPRKKGATRDKCTTMIAQP
jgi:hypothetical protein